MFVTLLAMKFAIAHGAEFVDEDVVARIKEEIMQRSNVGNTLACLSDVYGPRLTGTPRYLDMVEWAAGQLRDWGIENVWTERYGDDLRGWEIENYSATMTSPSFAQLNAQPVCCSASTDGVVTGSPLLLDIYDIEALRASSGKLRGRILLLSQVSEESHGVSGAWPDDRLEQAASRTNPVTPDSLDGPGSDISFVERLRQRDENDDQSDQELANILLQEGVAAVIRSSSAPAGIVNNRFDSGPVEFRRIGDPKPVPFFVIPRDQHSRLLALIDHGVAPQLSLNLAVRYYEDPALHVNLMAEIPGSDAELKDEIVFSRRAPGFRGNRNRCCGQWCGRCDLNEVFAHHQSGGSQARRTIRVVYGAVRSKAAWFFCLREEAYRRYSGGYIQRSAAQDLCRTSITTTMATISAEFIWSGMRKFDVHFRHSWILRRLRRRHRYDRKRRWHRYPDLRRSTNPQLRMDSRSQYYFSHQLDTNLDVTSLVNIESVQQTPQLLPVLSITPQ